MDSLEENLEFFSADGRPLRASLSLSIAQQQITEYGFGSASGGGGGGPGAASGGGGPGGRPSSPGTAPLARAKQGDFLAGMLDQMAATQRWQAVAAANAIEDPLRVAAGSLLDFGKRAADAGQAAFGIGGGR